MHHRFVYEDLVSLVRVLEIPDPYITSHRDHIPAVEALAILCNRFATPSRLSDLAARWGRDIGTISRVVNDLATFILNRWRVLLTDFLHFSTSELEDFCAAYAEAGCPIDCVIGSIDATHQHLSRPKYWQEALYTGHTKDWGLKYDSTTTPDGMLANVSGPIEARRADATLFRTSELPEQLDKYAFGRDGRRLYLYRDPAYTGYEAYIMPGLKKVGKLTLIEKAFNSRMAKLRQSVEWGFGKLFNLWTFLDHSRGQRIHMSPVGTYFLVCCLLTNAHTCLYGSQISQYFQRAPPSLSITSRNMIRIYACTVVYRYDKMQDMIVHDCKKICEYEV
ncbi:hypothetical protein PENSPDRAFT_594395 [Peniophora sp. CONT]|nr:hypothetical protein PENSPDRAFT_594395 [Peniophora sp. CONT]